MKRMDETIRGLLARMNGNSQDFSEAEIAEILQQARQEALAEAKSLLRERMLQTILKKALECMQEAEPDCAKLQPAPTAVTPAPTIVTPPPTVEPAPKAPAPDKNEIAKAEIEMLRKKIAENEQMLQQIKTPPAKPAEPVLAPPAAPLEATGAGYYVFGALRNDQNIPGLLANVEALGYPVYGLPYQDIQAAVCQVPLSEFGEEPLKANLENPAWLEARVRGHQSALEALSISGPVIPMKFCTIYLSEERAREALESHYHDFVENLQFLAGKQEWGVKLYYQRERLAEQLVKTSPRLQKIQGEIAKKSEGVAYFARKKLETAVSEEVERASDKISQTWHEHLTACVEQSRITPIHSKETTGRTDEMALNGAYLVVVDQFERFQAGLTTLTDEYADFGFSYELSGPWPPYNFVSLKAETGENHD